MTSFAPIDGEKSGGCPERCTEVRGECLPGPSACPPEGSLVVACSRRELIVTSWEVFCRVERSTGRRYAFRLLVSTEPAYLGWRDCTAQEANGVGPVR